MNFESSAAPSQCTLLWKIWVSNACLGGCTNLKGQNQFLKKKFHHSAAPFGLQGHSFRKLSKNVDFSLLWQTQCIVSSNYALFCRFSLVKSDFTNFLLILEHSPALSVRVVKPTPHNRQLNLPSSGWYFPFPQFLHKPFPSKLSKNWPTSQRSLHWFTLIDPKVSVTAVVKKCKQNHHQ